MKNVSETLRFVLIFAFFANIAVFLNSLTALFANWRLFQSVDFLVGWFAVWGEAHVIKRF